MAAFETRPNRGRPLDEARDAAIMAATADLLADVGYHAMSIDAVAGRAGVGKATIYRRWSGKRELVLATLRRPPAPVEDVPDTGSLRGDLHDLFTALEAHFASGAMDHLRGLLVVLRDDAQLAAEVRERLATSWTRATRMLVERATARGELAVEDDRLIDLFASAVPALVALRFFTHDAPQVERPLPRLVDDLLPILHAR